MSPYLASSKLPVSMRLGFLLYFPSHSTYYMYVRYMRLQCEAWDDTEYVINCKLKCFLLYTLPVNKPFPNANF